MNAIFLAIILGIVEGLTEFLPISSTGHLIVVERLVDFKDPNDIFTVVIQLGAMAAVVWYFRKDLRQRLVGLFRKEKQAVYFWSILAIATIPAGVVGLVIEKDMDAITTPTMVAISLIVGGIILWLIENKQRESKRTEPALEKITTKQSFWVGIAQAIAIIPGVSRSGATISGGLLAGMDRPTATAFSFYLGVPVLFLASAYKLVKHADKIDSVSGGWSAIIVGTLFAFASALLAVSWLLRYISRHNFKPFAYYRIVLGFIILLFIR